MGKYSIEIDAELYAYLKQHIVDFGETPNRVIKRLLGLSPASSDSLPQKNQAALPSKRSGLKRRPQASLSKLVSESKLEPGEELKLIINGKEVCKAKIDGDLISWENKRYSMSGLAVKFLQKEGYNTNHARGPAFWYTAKGKSVKELWDEVVNFDEFIG